MKPELVLIAGEQEGYTPEQATFLWSEATPTEIDRVYSVLEDLGFVPEDDVTFQNLTAEMRGGGFSR